MADKAWKRCERKLSSYFGGRRNPLSGRNSGHNTASDVLHSKLFIEVKYRKSQPVQRLYEEAREQARKEGKLPIVVLQEKGKPNALLVLSTCDVDLMVDILVDQRSAARLRDAVPSSGEEDTKTAGSPGKSRKSDGSRSRRSPRNRLRESDSGTT